MTRLIDVSVPIAPDLPTWPGDPPIEVERTSLLERGDVANVSRVHLGTHSGTHVDPPVHFLPGGRTVDEIEPRALIGPAWVAGLHDSAAEVSVADLEGAGVPDGTERLLLRTPNSGTLHVGAAFRRDYVSLSLEGARWVLGRGIRLVGIDYLSIERFDAPDEHPVHRALLEAGVVVVEGLDLSDAPPGPYELVCLPLRIASGDGAPARAFLLPVNARPGPGLSIAEGRPAGH